MSMLQLGTPWPRLARFRVIDEQTGKDVIAKESLKEAQDYILTEGDVVNHTVHDSETKEVWWFDDTKWRKD